MNKVYKVVWNNTLQCYTAVSEIAKSHTKNHAKAVVGSLLFTALLGVPSLANAENYDPDKSDYVDLTFVAKSDDSATFLKENTALTVDNELTVKTNAKVNGTEGQSIDVKGDAYILNDIKLDESYKGKEAPTSYLYISKLDVGGKLTLKADDSFDDPYTDGSWVVKPLSSLKVESSTVGKDLTLDKASIWLQKMSKDPLARGSMTVSGDVSLKASALTAITSSFTTKGDLTATDDSYIVAETGSAQIFVGNNMKISDGLIQIKDAGLIDVKGSADIDSTGFLVTKNSLLNVGEDLSFTGDALFLAQNNANVNVEGSVVIGNTGEDGNYNVSFEDGSNLIIGKDLTVKDDTYLFFNNGSKLDVAGNVELNNNKELDARSAFYDDVNVDVAGDFKVAGGSYIVTIGNVGFSVGGNLSFENDNDHITHSRFYDNTDLSVGKDLNLANNSVLVAGENVTISVGGNLNVNHTGNEEIWNELGYNTSLTVNGDLNMKGQYKAGVYDENNENGYFKNNFYLTGYFFSDDEKSPGSSALIKGNVHLSDNSHFFTQTYGQASDDHTTYHSRDEFEQLSSTAVEGNVTVERNSRLGAYSASDTLVKGNANITSGGSIQAWNSDAYLGIQGDVLVTDENSQIGVGRTAQIDIGGKLTAKNGADVYIGEDSTLSVAKKFLVDNATLEIHGGQLLLSGEDSVLDLTNNGVLKTDEAGSIELEKGASVNAKTKTLLSEDTTTTADGVAEKTFEADALSKVSIVDYDEGVSLEEAKRLRGILFNSNTGILDIKIKSDTDSGNASFEDALLFGGTSALANNTITGVDTSDKKLSDITPVDLSWGSASLKEGQSSLNLGSANLALNNPEANNGSFVSTSDGSLGNICMDNGANLALNGTGAIGDISTTQNGTGDILIGNDKTGSVSANNMGSMDKALGSISLGKGSSLKVGGVLSVASLNLNKETNLNALFINTPKLNAVGDDIKFSADTAKLGGLFSGTNSLMEINGLELADNFNVLGGAKVKAKNLSLKGKMLFADPDWNSNASVVVANNLSGDNGEVLDGALVAGQNSLVAIGDTLDENSAAALAKSALSENGTTALGYVGKDVTVAADGSITIDGSLTSAPATVEDNTVTVADKSALVLANNSKVSFESADGKVTNNGTVIVSSDTLSNNSKITAFSGDNVTVSGNGSFDVSSALFSANSNGDGTLTVNYDENKANRALYGTEANVAQSIKTAVASGVAVNKGTILGDLVNAGNSANTASTLSQLTRLGTLAGSVANAKLATDTTANAIDSRLASSGVKTNTQATAQSNKLTVWVQPVFSRQSSSSLDAGNTEYGIKTNLRGGVAGLDVTLGDNFVQGAAITVGSGNSSSKNIKSVSGDFDYYGFNLYGAYVNDALKLSYDLGYTKVSNDATAYNTLGKFTSDIDTKVFTLGIKGAYTFNTSVVNITPHLGVRYAKYDSDDYTASSGIYSVNNEGASSSLVSFPVGVSFSKDITLSSWTVVPTVNLEVIPVTGDKDVDTKSSFDGVVTSVNTKLHDGINYSTFVGLDALYGENFSLGINYNYTGSKNVDDHSVNAALHYTF